MSAVFVPQQTMIDVARYHRMIEAGIFGEQERIELIEGVLLDMAPIHSLHYSAVNVLNRLFVQALAAHRAEIAIQGPVTLGDLSEPEPDLAVLRPRADRYRHSVPGPADVLLLVEVAESSLAYDRAVKAPLFARFGVPEFWILNLVDGVLEVYRQPGARGYESIERLDRKSAATPAAFPEVRIDWGSAPGTSASSGA